MVSTRSKFKTVFFFSSFVFTLFILLLVLIEYNLLIRSLAYRVTSPDPLLRYVTLPNKIVPRGKFPRLNNFGFNDVNFDQQGLKLGNNILLLGDSTTMALDVDRDKNFASQAAIISKTKNLTWDFLNLGVFGYDIDQIEELFHRYQRAMNPIFVVYTFCLNDILNDQEAKEDGQNILSFFGAAQLFPGIASWQRELNSESHKKTTYQKDNVDDLWYLKKAKNEAPEQNYANFLAKVVKMNAAMKGNFSILLLPSRQIVYENESVDFLEHRLPGDLKRLKIKTIEVTKAMKQDYSKSGRYSFIDAVHLNEHGHALVSNDLVSFLVDKKNWSTRLKD